MRSRLALCVCLIVSALCPAQTPPPELSSVQIDNLAILGKVWGFLKYHHPAVTAGTRDWDRDLLGIIPAVLAAPDRASADAAMFRWVTDLGDIAECQSCVPPLPGDVVLSPDLAWLNDENLLGSDLSDLLRRVYLNRERFQQWYVSLDSHTRNPLFPHEAAYPAMNADFGLRILAVFRFWNDIEYWYPYRDVIGVNWDDVLKEYIPKVGLARSIPEYQRGVLRLAARINDSHVYVSASSGSVRLRVPEGSCMIPISLRFVENQAVIAAVLADGLAVERGDVVTEIDGESVSGIVEQLRPWYSASNEAAALREIAGGLTRGACREIKIRIRHNGEEKTVDVSRVPIGGGFRQRWIEAGGSHELAGPTFRMLSDTISYLKISSLKLANVREYVEAAQRAKGLIVDLRGAPSEPIWGELLRLVNPGSFARITIGDLSNPGAFRWDRVPGQRGLPTARPDLKIVVLVDELTQSNVEYGAMGLRSAPGVLLVGSTTAGADGNVSQILLPGDLRVQFTGTGVFFPDGRPTQRVGLIPDVRVTPTIAGIAAGRDEVVEEAVRQINANLN